MPTIVPEPTDHDRELVELAIKTVLSLAGTYTLEGVSIWLRSPHKMLAGRPAIELLYRGDDTPLRIAEGLADGVFF